MRLNLTTPEAFWWVSERHDRDFQPVPDKELAETKDFLLKQGGRRREGRSILKYVTEFTSAANEAAA